MARRGKQAEIREQGKLGAALIRARREEQERLNAAAKDGEDPGEAPSYATATSAPLYGTPRTLRVPRPMRPERRIEIGSAMAKLVAEANALEEEKKAVAKDLGEKIEGKYSDLSGFAAELRAGVEYEDVEARPVYDYERRLVYMAALGTGEVLEGFSRAMTEAERQRPLFSSETSSETDAPAATDAGADSAEGEPEAVDDLLEDPPAHEEPSGSTDDVDPEILSDIEEAFGESTR